MDCINSACLAIGLAVPIAVVGMPHGGLDHLFGRELFRPQLGRFWVLGFGFAYLGTAGFVMLGWLVAPALTLVLFFLVSAVHFGEAARVRQPLRTVEGGMVIWIPLFCRPSEVAKLIAWVVPGGDPELARFGIAAAQPLLWALSLSFLISLPTCNTPASAAGKVALAAVFAISPTLVSFTLYFCAMHSTRELMELARRARPEHSWLGLWTVIKAAAPMASLSVAATAIAAWLFGGGRPLQPVVVQAVFLGLSAVAVPHILLHAVARRVEADPFSRASGALRSRSHPEGAIA